MAGAYHGAVKQLILQYKFEHARTACIPLGAYIAAALPFLDESWVATTIPTIPGHVRARSFDHAELLAQEVARNMHVPFQKTLLRKQYVQQVGSTRAGRLAQAYVAFRPEARIDIHGKRVLVVDDVCTTGATLSAAATELRRAGAQEVWGGVAAYSLPTKNSAG